MLQISGSDRRHACACMFCDLLAIRSRFASDSCAICAFVGDVCAVRLPLPCLADSPLRYRSTDRRGVESVQVARCGCGIRCDVGGNVVGSVHQEDDVKRPRMFFFCTAA